MRFSLRSLNDLIASDADMFSFCSLLFVKSDAVAEISLTGAGLLLAPTFVLIDKTNSSCLRLVMLFFCLFCRLGTCLWKRP